MSDWDHDSQDNEPQQPEDAARPAPPPWWVDHTAPASAPPPASAGEPPTQPSPWAPPAAAPAAQPGEPVTPASWPPPPPQTWSPTPPSWPASADATAPGPAAVPPETGAPQPQPPSWWSAPPPPGGSSGGGWGPPPAWPGGGWQQPPAPPSPAKRILAIFAAVLLVLASAGVGAAVAIAVHKDSTSSAQQVPSNPFSPLLPGNNNGGSSQPSSGSGPLDASAISSKVTPALVNINTTLSQGRAAGSGMVISSNGEVLTNNHVIADATSIKVDIGGTGNTHNAHVVGYNVADDIALVQIEGVSNLKTVTFGDASKVNVGDPVVAIGNALGKGGTPTTTQGKVTALNQQVTAGDQAGGSTETLHGMIQIDAPIQPGDSGGALVNSDGQVIGMNTAAAGGRFTQQTGSNIAFAIPIDNAVSVIRAIQSGNQSGNIHIGARGLLGVSVRDVTDAQNAPADHGAEVVTVQDGSGAEQVGMAAGDVIVSIEGKSIADQNALRLSLNSFHPGDHVSVTWVDASGTSHTAAVTLGSGPPA